ncbi:hypothetical protein REPUB_Repub10bG0041600 [Reevesia pubescens]
MAEEPPVSPPQSCYTIRMMKINSFLRGDSLVRMSDHIARITCMRLFPPNETSLIRSEMQREENVLVTASYDQSIRLWWKGACQRYFRGHNGAFSTFTSGKRGQQALKATVYGHQKPVPLMSVAGVESPIRTYRIASNRGGKFYGCGRFERRRKCGFYEWVDEMQCHCHNNEILKLKIAMKKMEEELLVAHARKQELVEELIICSGKNYQLKEEIVEVGKKKS